MLKRINLFDRFLLHRQCCDAFGFFFSAKRFANLSFQRILKSKYLILGKKYFRSLGIKRPDIGAGVDQLLHESLFNNERFRIFDFFFVVHFV